MVAAVKEICSLFNGLFPGAQQMTEMHEVSAGVVTGEETRVILAPVADLHGGETPTVQQTLSEDG